MDRHWRRTTGLLAIAVAFVAGVAPAACGPNPEAPGDPCDPDDGCPDALVCAPGGDDNICYVAAGGACDPTTEDLCLDASICTAGTCLIPLGGACVAGGPDYCSGENVCGQSGLCQIPPGGACDPAGPDQCVDAMVCGETLAGDGVCGIAEGGTCDPAAPLCAGGLVCAELQAGGFACYLPVLVRGMVFDSATDAAIEGALVLALDDQATAVTDVATSDASGNYVLDLPVVRDANGAPVPNFQFTLRASAQDYQTFPGGLRTALPISSSEAAELADGYTIQTAITDIALIALPAADQGRPSISGTVLGGDESAGVLVIAEDANGVGISAISDLAGAYKIFNVPDGAQTVRGYAAGLQLDPENVTVAGADLTGVDLSSSGNALGSITGSVQIVNAPGGSMTSVVLVVASTFSDTFVRGEVPRGLRTPLSGPPNVTGGFTIDNVPAGSYVVLAAFENDGLVRDPDPNIAGTQIVTVDMASPGTDVTLADSFKITEALAVIGPGTDDPEPVTTAPNLEWADDSSEDFYTVVVYNAYGDLVWCLSTALVGGVTCDGPNIPGSSGADVSVPYGGPLDPGMYYQFRATSWRSPGGNVGPISNTEDLRGVFYVP
ncbi:MAG: carboxypeptidase regulatory-like domain-containing protein [Myxococcales bacterium]|nr:carboxypeptidase regulatory-like domain-containing protein [Myxococcales bacterium]